MKIKTKIKDNHLLVKTKFYEDDFCEREFNVFAGRYIHGFLKPCLEKKNKIIFSGPVSKSLFDRLKEPISKYDVLFIVELIIEIFRKAKQIGVPTNKILLDLKYIFYNESTKSVWVMYLPFKNEIVECSIKEFMLILLQQAQLINQNDANTISELALFIAKLKTFDSELVERYIYRLDRDVVNAVRKHNTAGSGFITNKRKDYYEHYERENENDIDDNTNLLDEDDNTNLLDEYDNTGLLDKDDNTGLLDEDDNTGLLDEDDNTGLLDEDDNTGLLDEDDNTGLLDDDDDTGLLNEDDDTSLLIETINTVHFPKLVRCHTGEEILINKPVFRIGKEKSYVDYFVFDNNAVSRSHADIISRGEHIFVVDLNSKNRTFINDRVLPVKYETEIFDGDVLKLANEEFVFCK